MQERVGTLCYHGCGLYDGVYGSRTSGSAGAFIGLGGVFPLVQLALSLRRLQFKGCLCRKGSSLLPVVGINVVARLRLVVLHHVLDEVFSLGGLGWVEL